MSTQEPSVTVLSVDEIVAMTDGEISRLMQKNRRSNGDIQLPVDGWDHLSKDERDRLAERLIVQERALAQNPTIDSRPLDLDQLDARLRAISSSENNTLPSTRPPPIDTSRPPTPWFDFDAIEIDQEKAAHSWLVEDGGRPLYPVTLIEEVKSNPEIYCELLRPWKDNWRADYYWAGPHDIYDSWQVFKRQLKRWQDFRKWQRDNRGLDDGGFPAYVEWKKRMLTLLFVPEHAAEEVFKIETDSSYLKENWEIYQDRHAVQGYYCREAGLGDDDFSIYAEAMKRRLARHGFTGSFQLQKDPMQQDAMTTWVEYLNYEYFWLDWFSKVVQRLKPDRDKAWQKLIDSKVLRPHETETSLRIFMSQNQLSADKKHASETLERATSKTKQIYTLIQSEPRRRSISQQSHLRPLLDAKRELLAAKIKLASVKRRADLFNEFFDETSKYHSMMKDESRHRLLLSWVLDQFPLLEVELVQSETTALNPSRIKDTKRKFDVSDDSLEKRDLKKQKLDRKVSLFANEEVATKVKMDEGKHQQILKYDEKSISHNMILRSKVQKSITKRLDCSSVLPLSPSQGECNRRSARIAARQAVSINPN